MPRLIGDPVVSQRQCMVSRQIERCGIRNPDVLRVMRSTPRHLFVPAGVRSDAYQDYPLSIGHGATISQPYIVAFMTELLAVEKAHRVLEIGTGSGYQAAILAQLADAIYSIELVPELALEAAGRLREMGYSNVTVRQGDGYRGWPEQAPFDRIVVTAAPREVPAALIAQLSREGRLVAPVGSALDQHLVLLEKSSDGAINRTSLSAVRFVPMEREDR